MRAVMGWRARAAVAAVLCGAALGACEAPDETEATGEAQAFEPTGTVELPGPRTEEEASAPDVLLTAEFQTAPDAQGRPIGGTARALAVQGPEVAGDVGGFHLHVRVEGLEPGPHAWLIREGPCERRDAPVVVAFTPADGARPLPGAEPLMPGAEGVAQQTVLVPGTELTFQQLRAGDYSLRVHRGGGAEPGPAVACADL